ncbi:type IX secretion system outer membrane channel protein PorV [Mucilaginibacter sp. UYCu711]|uniref:type IX secretion system outer membrane channel protein PorV n=1 Tax=Mucilaginibacter sp. UYCu711 TaxID=3156339 RepID=UPI003D222F30
MKFLYGKASIIYIILLSPLFAAAQVGGVNANGSAYNSIHYVVPFLTISPDSRSGAMGDAGVALSPDVNANYWNPSKLAFLDTSSNAIGLSYSPWLRHLVPDVSISYLSFAHNIDKRNAIGMSMRYFNLGSIQLVDANQNDQGTYRPSEFSIDGSFARKFGNNFSLGLTLRYIHSNLFSQSFVSGSSQAAKPGNAVAADISMYHTNSVQQFGKDATFSYGIDISNIGSKISYSDVGQSYFLPTNLRMGVANTINIDEFNQLTLAFDINKLLVPTSPIRDANGNIIKGHDDNVSVPAGIFGSFSDAPGGFSEELKEITFAPGFEYVYDQQFALRGGYFYENAAKGGRQFLTLGLGLKYDIYRFDFSYLAASQQSSPLANTLRFSLSVNFGAAK